jgi:lipopolysaccharide transport system ATP-binding protein
LPTRSEARRGELSVRCEGISKSYRIGGAPRYRSLRESLMQSVSGGGRGAAETIWALRDVSFEIRRAEVIGVIGRNGAGKSTLLKLLSRITRPTKGRVTVHGRVGSLLEVGTGFHPELTGRENIYLNGAILGMRRREIDEKFERIIAFAEVEKFLDTPTKHYSSGMYMRLAFSVAAHLDPEILLVDEVLAVGDAAFQKKCLGRMSEIAGEGRTIFLVSHNMSAIMRLCDRVMWLEGGCIRDIGEPARVVGEYLTGGVVDAARATFEPPIGLPGRMPVWIHALEIGGSDGRARGPFSTSACLRIAIEWECSQSLYKPRVGFILSTSEGVDVLTALDATGWNVERVDAGRYRSRCEIPGGLLNSGEYLLELGADSPQRQDFDANRTGPIARFELEEGESLPNKYYGQHGCTDGRWDGVLLLDVPWTCERLDVKGA